MKKLLCVITSLLVLALAGCNNASGIATTPAPTRPVATTPVQTTAPTTPAPTEPTTAEPVDELEMLRVTPEKAQRGGLYLIRDEKFYVLNEVVTPTLNVSYHPGALKIFAAQNLVSFYYIAYRDNVNMSVGYVPVPELGDSDKIIAYSDSEVPTLVLYPSEHVGYSFFIESMIKEYYLLNVDTGEELKLDIKTDFEVRDSNGTLVDNYRQLEKDAEYTVSWYTGTRYNEIKLRANCLNFTYNEKSAIYIDGKVTKEGYAEYDFSSVPAGEYAIGYTGLDCAFLIRIK